MESTVGEIVALVGGELRSGSADSTLSGFESLDHAGSSELSFYGNVLYVKAFAATKAGAVLVPLECEGDLPEGAAIIAVESPVLAFDLVVRKYGAPEIPFIPGIHPSAVVADDVEIDSTKVSIGANVVIEAGAKIGNGTTIRALVTVSQGVTIGEDCLIHSNVAIREGGILGNRVIIHSGAVIGSDGYGYEFKNGRHEKVRQAGIVELHDDVEIGGGATIDRARFGSTTIGEGTKVDNLCQIAHNVIIGKHCLIVAQTGISGSAKIGNYVTVAAQSGIAGHITIGDKAVLGGRSGVIASIEGGESYFGYPARPMKETLKANMYQKKIPKLLARVSALEAQLKEQSK